MAQSMREFADMLLAKASFYPEAEQDLREYIAWGIANKKHGGAKREKFKSMNKNQPADDVAVKLAGMAAECRDKGQVKMANALDRVLSKLAYTPEVEHDVQDELNGITDKSGAKGLKELDVEIPAELEKDEPWKKAHRGATVWETMSNGREAHSVRNKQTKQLAWKDREGNVYSDRRMSNRLS